MPAFPSPLLCRAVMIAALAFVPMGCGVKSGLEQPQASRAAPAGTDASKSAQETSSVQTGRAFNLLPPETPPEWEKERSKKKGSSFGKAGSKSTAPDKPFILDRLL